MIVRARVNQSWLNKKWNSLGEREGGKEWVKYILWYCNYCNSWKVRCQPIQLKKKWRAARQKRITNSNNIHTHTIIRYILRYIRGKDGLYNAKQRQSLCMPANLRHTKDTEINYFCCCCCICWSEFNINNDKFMNYKMHFKDEEKKNWFCIRVHTAHVHYNYCLIFD